jgi:hypothetical protein
MSEEIEDKNEKEHLMINASSATKFRHYPQTNQSIKAMRIMRVKIKASQTATENLIQTHDGKIKKEIKLPSIWPKLLVC